LFRFGGQRARRRRVLSCWRSCNSPPPFVKAFVLRADRQRPFASVDPWTAPASRVWTNPRVSLEEWPVPERVGAHDVIVRVAWCGICGSDLHCSTAGPDGAVEFGGPARLPVVLGHEFTGTAVDVG